MSKDPTNLGELEMAILEYLWEQRADKVKTVHQVIGEARNITVNTVQSTMKRLWEKGLLDREKSGHAYMYSARIGRRELTEMMVGQLVDQVTSSKIEIALQAFVDLAERAGDDTLVKLEQLVAERRAADEE